MPNITIKEGTAKISGKIIDNSNIEKKGTIVFLAVSHPVTGSNTRYKAQIDENGNFTFNVNIETTLSISGISSDINLYKSLLIPMENNKETQIEITYDENTEIEKVILKSDFYLSDNDIVHGIDAMSEMIDYRSERPRERLYEKNIDYFLDYANKILEERLNIADSNTFISDKMKSFVKKDFSLFFYNAHVFSYKDEMLLNYYNINNNSNPDSLKISTPSISYYSFLKNFKLNDSQHLYCFTFPVFQNTILSNDIINIPTIGEIPIEDWLNKTKNILVNLLGFDNGLYYDILVANAYSMQFNDRLEPLSDKQMKNIKDYFKGGEIEKILFRKNKETIRLKAEKTESVVNSTPEIQKEELMSIIISAHKGKVVLVDFWATWCGPCLEAMKDSRDLKSNLKDKDVVFVYITNPSSPKKLWEEQINGIGGEHYYLEEEEWEYIMNNFGFNGIPCYLVYNKEGVLSDKFIGYQGNEEIRKKLENLAQ